MNTEYYTVVQASSKFWERLISKSINLQSKIKLIDDESGFTITSHNIPSIQEIIKLSECYPEEVFDVIISTNDLYNNFFEQYKLRGGKAIESHIKPIYHFEYLDDVGQKVAPIVLNNFKDEIAELLDRLNQAENRFRKIKEQDNPTKEVVSNIELKYADSQYVLTAKVKGKTYIDMKLVSYASGEALPF